MVSKGGNLERRRYGVPTRSRSLRRSTPVRPGRPVAGRPERGGRDVSPPARSSTPVATGVPEWTKRLVSGAEDVLVPIDVCTREGTRRGGRGEPASLSHRTSRLKTAPAARRTGTHPTWTWASGCIIPLKNGRRETLQRRSTTSAGCQSSKGDAVVPERKPKSGNVALKSINCFRSRRAGTGSRPKGRRRRPRRARAARSPRRALALLRRNLVGGEEQDERKLASRFARCRPTRATRPRPQGPAPKRPRRPSSLTVRTTRASTTGQRAKDCASAQ